MPAAGGVEFGKVRNDFLGKRRHKTAGRNPVGKLCVDPQVGKHLE